MNWAQIRIDAVAAAKPGFKKMAGDVIAAVIIPQLVDPVIDFVKAKIPGVWDDALLEGLKPQIKANLQKLVSTL